MAYPKTRKLRQGGLFGTPEYYTWQNMLQRCYNSKHKQWADYGARGITVCDSWIGGDGVLSAVQCFVRDMGLRPSPNHTIERKHNDREYSKHNCLWATREQQSANRRNTVFVEWDGNRVALSHVTRMFGIVPVKLASLRVRALGWPVKDAVTIPVGQKRPQP